MFKTLTDEQRSQSNEVLSGKSGGGMYGSILKSGVNIPGYKPIDGINKIRLLPPLEADPHSTFGGAGLWTFFCNGSTVISPTSFNPSAKDPVLERYRKYKLTDPEGKGKSRHFKPSRKVINYILSYNPDDDPRELKVWITSKAMIERVLGAAQDLETGKVVPIDCPADGRAILFKKTGKNLQTRYINETISKDPDPIEEIMEIGAKMRPFEEIIRVPSIEELENFAEDLEAIAESEGGRDIPEDDTDWDKPSIPEQDVEIEKRDDANDAITAKIRQQMEKGKKSIV